MPAKAAVDEASCDAEERTRLGRRTPFDLFAMLPRL